MEFLPQSPIARVGLRSPPLCSREHLHRLEEEIVRLGGFGSRGTPGAGSKRIGRHIAPWRAITMRASDGVVSAPSWPRDPSPLEDDIMVPSSGMAENAGYPSYTSRVPGDYELPDRAIHCRISATHAGRVSRI